jgi:hypothetical protein
MTVEMWMGLGIIVAIVGFVLWKTALNLRAKGNRNAGMFSTIAWLLQAFLTSEVQEASEVLPFLSS